MATIGISKPYFAVYSNTSGTTTYSNGAVMGKSTTASLSLEGADNNILYADNAPAESVNQFAGGTLTMGTDDIYDAAATLFLGLETNTMTGGGTELIFDDQQAIPYVGIGFIVKKMQSGNVKYQGVIFPKTQAQNPNYEIATQGETIEWQTPEVVFNLLRDDTTYHVWQRQALFDTEADAEAYLRTYFGITGTGG